MLGRSRQRRRQLYRLRRLGLRWDSQSYTDDDALLSPRFNLLYRPTDRDAIRLAWGIFGQSQWIHELRVQDGVEEFFPAQRSQNVILGYEHGALASVYVLLDEGRLMAPDDLARLPA